MYFRKIIQIKAEDSPNVKVCLLELARRGDTPEVRRELIARTPVFPGVLTFAEYCHRRKTWDEERQAVGLDAVFYQGKAVMMYPEEWRVKSADAEGALRRLTGLDYWQRHARAIGIDTGEGLSDTVWTAVDELGIIDQEAEKTSDTSDVPGKTIAFAKKHGVPPDFWMFDAGGGGKQHADTLRRQGFVCRTVRFGEGMTPDPRSGLTTKTERLDIKEDKYVYKNRRAEMGHELRLCIDPNNVGWIASFPGVGLKRSELPFCIPRTGPLERQMAELNRQMKPIPLQYDREGQIWLPPKNKWTN